MCSLQCRTDFRCARIDRSLRDALILSEHNEYVLKDTFLCNVATSVRVIMPSLFWLTTRMVLPTHEPMKVTLEPTPRLLSKPLIRIPPSTHHAQHSNCRCVAPQVCFKPCIAIIFFFSCESFYALYLGKCINNV